MSLGLQFIQRAIQEGNAAAIRAARPEWFIEDERAAFEATVNHIRQYGQLPSANALRAVSVTLPELRGGDSVQWFTDRLIARAAYRAVNELHPELASAMQSRDMESVESVLKTMATRCSSIRHRDSYSTLATEAARVVADFENAQRHVGLLGCSLRWEALNEVTLGAQGGDVITIVGRPGLGKSWVLNEIAYDNYILGRRGAFVSMEMGLKQIVRRFMARRSGANPSDIRKGELPEWAQADLRACVSEFESGPQWQFMAGDMQGNVGAIEAMVELFRPEILFVDSAYLLSPSARMNNGVSKWETIGQVIKELKRIAVSFDIPVVITVQFNRNQKKNSRKDMDLSDIAGSDSIPQDSSIVIGMRPGPPPYTDIVREMVMMKNREGDCVNWFINFGFRPVNFDELYGFDPSSSEQPETLTPDLGWMEE